MSTTLVLNTLVQSHMEITHTHTSPCSHSLCFAIVMSYPLLVTWAPAQLSGAKSISLSLLYSAINEAGRCPVLLLIECCFIMILIQPSTNPNPDDLICSFTMFWCFICSDRLVQWLKVNGNWINYINWNKTMKLSSSFSFFQLNWM